MIHEGIRAVNSIISLNLNSFAVCFLIAEVYPQHFIAVFVAGLTKQNISSLLFSFFDN